MRLLPLPIAVLVVACADGELPTAARPAHHAADAWAPGPPEPVIDGLMQDWSSAERLATDTAGDAAEALDVTALYATSRGTRLFVRFDTAAATNLYSGPPGAGGLWLGIALPDGRQLEVDFRSRLAQLDGTGDIVWSALGLVVAPSHAARQHELRVDLGAFGVELGDSLRLGMRSWDEDERVAPSELVLSHHPAAPIAHAPGRHAEARLRIASLNTHEAGLVDAARHDATARLLRTAAADVYCLQELGSTPASVVAESLASVEAGAWQVHAVGAGDILGNAIASKRPLLPIPTGNIRFAAAVVLGDPTLAVFDVHLKCCGYQGSAEDAERLTQAEALADVIGRFREGELGSVLAEHADAPVVVVGDFNDVGSEELHTRLTRAADPGLERWILPHLEGPDVFTWVSSSDSYPPAMLDLLFHDPRLEPLSGYVVDSRELSLALREDLDLKLEDSSASDHLLLVADFR